MKKYYSETSALIGITQEDYGANMANLYGFEDNAGSMTSVAMLNSTVREVWNVSSTNLNPTMAIKILVTLQNINSLKILEINNNFIDDTAVHSIVHIISHNHLLEELDISYNKFTVSGVIRMVQALLKNKYINILDISKSFRDCDSYERTNKLAIALMQCPSLQELNVSNNLLTFTSVINIVQALKDHPCFKLFNISDNITSYFLECEFLIDIMLSVNQVVTNVNVCERNIRPRFNDACFFFPPNCEESSSRFALQNLYFTQTVVVNKCNQGSSDAHINFIKANEECPISSKGIISYYVDHSGGTFYNQDHNFALVIPPGAILRGDCVEIQATASNFGPYKLPDGYYPISAYFWLSAYYTFAIPVYLIMSHYAKQRNVGDIDNLCVLKACVRDLTVSEGKLVMKEVSNGVHFDYELGYCILTADHFCSFCMAKKIKLIPERFSALLYTSETDDSQYIAEVCFCPAISACRKVASNLILMYVVAIIRHT